jgi:Flp pilus assembly protein TadB
MNSAMDAPAAEDALADAEGADAEGANGAGAAGVAAPAPSLLDDIQALIADGRTYAETELAFQKSRAFYAAGRGKAIALFGALAAVLLVFALFALVVGTILVLTPSVGPLLAMLYVVGGLLFTAALCGLVVLRNVQRLKRAFSGTAES